MNWLLMLLIFLLGILAGFFIWMPATLRMFKIGTLLIDRSDPLTDKYSFEVTKDLNKLPQYSHVSLEVKEVQSERKPMTVTEINKLLMPPYPEESQ